MTSFIEGFANEGIVDLLLLTLTNVNGVDQDTNSDSFVYIEGSGQSFIRYSRIRVIYDRVINGGTGNF